MPTVAVLVDDVSLRRRVVSELEGAGAQVWVRASSCLEEPSGLDGFELAVLDAGGPRGPSLLDAMQRSAPRLPCIALAGARDPYPVGADGVLLVPLAPGALRRMAAQILAADPAASAA